ncbi:MAG: class II D-tagatose-bisphosphate aldolase, non-catalytic subunit [Spirochaetota bacterium]
MDAVRTLQERLQNNLKERQGGIYSVCSSKEEIVRSALHFARAKHYPLVIESTSNQVDQFGGYTGMTPQDFAHYVYQLADSCAFPKENLILGGDHLGPNAWQNEAPEPAMNKAVELVQAYIRASYRKIHLDTSMPCKGDPLPLTDEIVARRAAKLAQAAEAAWREGGCSGPAPVYIIGTEVPTPGGSAAEEEFLKPTFPDAARKTHQIHQAAFAKAGLESVWEERVIAMVVQPGVEFGDAEVIYFEAEKSRELSRLAPELGIVFEAHSTDYQRPQGLRELVENHFAILKVGPWLSYAYREALFALSYIAEELRRYGLSQKRGELPFRQRVHNYLAEHPQHWQKYYRGTPEQISYKMLYSLSDRIRYYWPQKEMQNLIAELMASFGGEPLPYSLVSQYFPQAVQALEPRHWQAPQLIEQHIQSVLAQYDAAVACAEPRR